MKIIAALVAAVVVGFMIALLIRVIVGVTPPPAPEPTGVNMTDRTDKPCRCGERENDHDQSR